MPKILLSDCSFARSKFITLVDIALSLHKGPLDDFTISGDKSYQDVFDRWMLMLSKKSPSSITIKLTSGPKYKIPSILFTINDLEYLCLQNCIISLPRVFDGFKWLTVLNLEIFSSTDSDINNLISFCPVLSVLTLRSFDGINCLNIQAPELEYLEVDGNFEDFHLDATNLNNAIVTLPTYQSVPVVHDGKSYLNQALGSLRDIKTLTIDGYFLTYLSKGCLQTKLPAVFDQLENVLFDICFWDQREVLTACTLIQNAPILKKLELRSYPCSEFFGPMSMWDQDQTSIRELTLQMDHLVTVSVNDFLGMDYEVAFVGKLLSWAPVLEEVKINGNSKKDDSIVLKKLLALPRLSDKAKVIVT